MPTPDTSPVSVGIYARKSKYVKASESVATQVSLCRELALRQSPGCQITVYDEDEGFSGGNTNRPGFIRLMEDVRHHRISFVYVYRLDRIARSVLDFCITLQDLQRHRVSFVSVRENFFDTSTSMGRTMLIFASAIAQLERELIAERTHDSLHALARRGRWLGGQTPTGFSSNRDDRGWCYLEPIHEELEMVSQLYEHFVSLGSLSALYTYCLQHGLKSKNGVDFSRTTLRSILTNPVYCAADADSLLFFSSHDYSLAAESWEFDGYVGIMPYNRTTKAEASTIQKPTSSWIIAVGAHPGTVPGALWVRAQQIFEQNRELGAAWHGRRTEVALLSGLIRCGNCGSAMRPRAYGQPLSDGSRRFSYICTRKIDSRGQLCSIANAPGNDVDATVLHHLQDFSAQFDSLSSGGADLLASSAAQAAEDSIRALQQEIKKAQQQLDNLTDTLAEGVPAAARKQIYQRMDELSCTISEKEAAIESLTASQLDEQQQLTFAQQLAVLFSSFGDGFQSLTHDEKRRLIHCAVSSVVWDGENVAINIAGVEAAPG